MKLRSHIAGADSASFGLPKKEGLAGARASFLSRKTNGAHILIADAYTDGIIRFQVADH